jgi:hypothetical protein
MNVVVSNSEALSQHFPGETEVKHENPRIASFKGKNQTWNSAIQSRGALVVRDSFI